LLSPVIEGYRHHNDDAGDDLLDPVRQAVLRAADLDHGHDGRPAHCADHGAAPPLLPIAVPLPPGRLPPPMITAAITSSSRPTATVGSPTDSRENCSTPATPASAAVSAYTATLQRST